MWQFSLLLVFQRKFLVTKLIQNQYNNIISLCYEWRHYSSMIQNFTHSIILLLSRTFLMSKYGLSFSDAGFVNSFVYIIPAAAFPFIGLLVDKTGFNLIWRKCSKITQICFYVGQNKLFTYHIMMASLATFVCMVYVQ